MITAKNTRKYNTKNREYNVNKEFNLLDLKKNCILEIRQDAIQEKNKLIIPRSSKIQMGMPWSSEFKSVNTAST